MLLWQQNMHEYDDTCYDVRWDIARKALLYASSVYLAFFLILFIASCTTKGPVEPIIIRVQNAPVLFTGSSHRKVGKRQNGTPSKAQQAVAQRSEKTTQKKISEPVKNKKESKKAEKKIKPQIKTKELKAKEQKKQKLPEKIQAPARKTVEPKASESPKKEEKKIEPKKKESKKVEEKVVKHEEQKKNFQAVAPEEPAIDLVSQQPEELATIVAGVDFDGSIEEGAYDAQTKAHMALSRAIARAWKAPQVNIKDPAHIRVDLDGGGKPTIIEFEKKSGVVMYDIEARAAIMRAEFPQEFWGKKFIIIFGE